MYQILKNICYQALILELKLIWLVENFQIRVAEICGFILLN